MIETLEMRLMTCRVVGCEVAGHFAVGSAGVGKPIRTPVPSTHIVRNSVPILNTPDKSQMDLQSATLPRVKFADCNLLAIKASLLFSSDLSSFMVYCQSLESKSEELNTFLSDYEISPPNVEQYVLEMDIMLPVLRATVTCLLMVKES